MSSLSLPEEEACCFCRNTSIICAPFHKGITGTGKTVAPACKKRTAWAPRPAMGRVVDRVKGRTLSKQNPWDRNLSSDRMVCLAGNSVVRECKNVVCRSVNHPSPYDTKTSCPGCKAGCCLTKKVQL
eukprot:scaffold46407_cov176-Amphora_coffeaeformis.AAC.1